MILLSNRGDLVRPRRLIHRKLRKLGPSGNGIVHSRDTRDEEQAAVEKDDSADPSAIDRASSELALRNFRTVNALAQWPASSPSNMSIPLFEPPPNEERLDRQLLARVGVQLKRSITRLWKGDHIGGRHNLLCERHCNLRQIRLWTRRCSKPVRRMLQTPERYNFVRLSDVNPITSTRTRRRDMHRTTARL